MQRLAERSIDFAGMAAVSGQPDADPFDLLCHITYDVPMRTRRERTERLRLERQDFFDRYGSDARAILDELLDKFAAHGVAQFVVPDVFKLPLISDYGNVGKIMQMFGGVEALKEAMAELKGLLYAA